LDHFEFILIITSVIFALAVAQVLSGVSRIAQSKSDIRFFLPHSIWALNLGHQLICLHFSSLVGELGVSGYPMDVSPICVHGLGADAPLLRLGDATTN
jgi:hypothetical protein